MTGMLFYIDSTPGLHDLELKRYDMAYFGFHYPYALLCTYIYKYCFLETIQFLRRWVIIFSKEKCVFKHFVFAHSPFCFAPLQVLGSYSILVAHEDFPTVLTSP